jgi:post-segregation antitoxin (ccd killing protein)
MSSSPFADHYEQTRIDGKEHPADVVINNLPGIIRFKRRLSKLSEELRQSVRDPKPFMAYVDTRGLYQSTRENLFFNAGFEHGLLAARQDCLAERMANNPVARRLLSEINQLTLTTELPRNRVAMLLLEAAWAMIYGIAIPGTASPTVSPELAAIREALWPDGNMEAVWSPDTIDQIASIARPHDQNGGTKGGRRG